MRIEDFKAGKYIDQYQYKSFLPEKINHEWIIASPEINSLLSDANRLIGELNAFSQLIPDVDYFIKMHITKEATTSSQIEGTKTNIEDVLIKEEDISPEKRDDWNEVQNYINAINYSVAQLETLPISNRLIRNTHKTLLCSGRGEKKNPGEFRKSQNWIGVTLKDAIYIPPHQSAVPDLMTDLESFLNNRKLLTPHLIRIAIAHYQFETIHPFLDGNGRIGRLLITLYLVSNGILNKPSLYLSDFFEKNRTHYFDNLMISRTKNNLSQWIKFFLVGIIETASSSINVFKRIIILREKTEIGKISKMGSKSKRGLILIKSLYQNPITDSNSVCALLDIAPSTANRLIADFQKNGILEELTGFKRNRKFIFREYFNIFQK
jgi:Fic family protein